MSQITGWGRGTWSEGTWGSDLPVEATGIQLQSTTNTVSIAIGQIVDLNTNLLQITTGTFSFEISGSVELSTNLLNVTTGSVSSIIDVDILLNTNLLQINLGDESGVGNADVVLSTNILNTTIGAYSITADGNTSEIVVGDSLNSALGSIDAGAGSLVFPIGQELNINIGDESLIGNATVDLTTNILNVTTGTATGDVATVILTGSSIVTSTGTVSFTIDGSVTLTGVNMTASTGRVFITAWAVIDIGVTNTWGVIDIAA